MVHNGQAEDVVIDLWKGEYSPHSLSIKQGLLIQGFSFLHQVGFQASQGCLRHVRLPAGHGHQ